MHFNWPETDPAVVARFLKGDEVAFRTIYDAFVPGLLAYATSICGSREQAEDIVQDVFVNCWEKRSQIIEKKLGNWLVKVTKNLSVKAFRQNVLMAEYTIQHSIEPSPAISLTPVMDDSAREAQAMKIVETLPPVRKKIFLLSRIEQKTYREIADDLGISVRTVENQLSAALRQIRLQLAVTSILLVVLFLIGPFR